MNTVYLYWLSTGLLSLVYLISAVTYLTKKTWVEKKFSEFGYPSYLIPILAIVKILSVIILLLRFNIALSDLIYAGMFFHLLLSALAHIGIRKSPNALPAALGLIFLTISFITQNTARETTSPYFTTASPDFIISERNKHRQ